MKKILLTGFEPFQKESVNPSRELALSFQDQYDTLILPVSYRRSFEALKSHLERGPYDFVLMIGQAGGRAQIEVERVAINLRDAEIADEDGDCKMQWPIVEGGVDAYLNPLPLRELLQALNLQNIPVRISLSAGAFVCNSVYYQIFDWIKKTGRPLQALFVHVPYLPEQTKGKAEGTPAMTFEDMRKGIGELLRVIAQSDLRDKNSVQR